MSKSSTSGSGPRAPAARDRLRELEDIELKLADSLLSAGTALQELSKEKPSLKQVDQHSKAFLSILQNVEIGIAEQIHYLTQVSTVQPHEGSSYATQKDADMASHRLEHVKSRLRDLQLPEINGNSIDANANGHF